MCVTRRRWLILCGAAGIAGLPLGPARGQARTITVFAAASLGDAFRALQGPFEKKHAGLRLRFNFAASSILRVQVQQGAPADVFASADWEQMQPLVSSRLAVDPKVCARNRVVVAVPTANPGKVRTVKDLVRPGIRLVGTAESVPIGRYSRQVLEKLGRIKGFPPDFFVQVDRNMLSREANVRAVLAKVELGEADAAIVYESDAHSSTRVRQVTLPAAANVVAEYPIAVVSGSPQAEGGKAFVKFVLSRDGQAVLRRHGFQ